MFDRWGDRPFLVWEPFDGPVATWTYARFGAEVRALAAGLQAGGLAVGERVALVLENSPEFLRAWSAVVLAGGTAVCLNPSSSRDELSYYGSHAEISGAFAAPSSLVGDAMPGLRFLSPAPGDPAAFRPPPPDPARPASIQYTSGTTARPKAVVWTAANCRFAGRTGAAHQRLTGADVYLVHLPLFHTNALSYSFLSVVHAGATMVLQPRFSVSRFWEVSVRNRCTWTSVVTFCVRALASSDAPPAHSFRGWGHSACIAPGDGPGRVGAMGWYGMTETVSQPICGSPACMDRPGSMGRPAPEYGVRVVAEDSDGVGELQVRGVPGRSLFAGYLGDPAATAVAYTPDGWFRTGDRVRRDGDGTLWFVERDKDVLKVAGENVGAPEIERVLLTVAGVREAAVVGRPDPMRGEVPVAFVVASSPAVAAAASEACAQMLPPYKRPVEVRVVDDLPRSTLEKVAKAELRRLAARW
jgi:crotonobetaine/carnitine-CoA ligase